MLGVLLSRYGWILDLLPYSCLGHLLLNLERRKGRGTRSSGKRSNLLWTRSPPKGLKSLRKKKKTSAEGSGFKVALDRRSKTPIWNPLLVLDGASLPSNLSIRDFQQGKANYVANSLEQVLLLPQDMADLRSLKKHKVFLTLKNDLAMVGVYLCIPIHIPKHHPYLFFYVRSSLTLLSILFCLYKQSRQLMWLKSGWIRPILNLRMRRHTASLPLRPRLLPRRNTRSYSSGYLRLRGEGRMLKLPWLG